MTEIRNSSKTLGILSICLGCILPLAGVTLSIIGLSIKKAKPDRDIYLNVIGLVLSISMWIFYFELLTLLGY